MPVNSIGFRSGVRTGTATAVRLYGWNDQQLVGGSMPSAVAGSHVESRMSADCSFQVVESQDRSGDLVLANDRSNDSRTR